MKTIYRPQSLSCSVQKQKEINHGRYVGANIFDDASRNRVLPSQKREGRDCSPLPRGLQFILERISKIILRKIPRECGAVSSPPSHDSDGSLGGLSLSDDWGKRRRTARNSPSQNEIKDTKSGELSECDSGSRAMSLDQGHESQSETYRNRYYHIFIPHRSVSLALSCDSSLTDSTVPLDAKGFYGETSDESLDIPTEFVDDESLAFTVEKSLSTFDSARLLPTREIPDTFSNYLVNTGIPMTPVQSKTKKKEKETNARRHLFKKSGVTVPTCLFMTSSSLSESNR